MTDDPQVQAMAEAFDEARKSFTRNLAVLGAQMDQMAACLRDGDEAALLELCDRYNRPSTDKA
jgi:hypothetical protein